MQNKRIGIVAWKIGDNSIGITTPYYEYFRIFGEINLLTPSMGIMKDLDLVVIPGGKDVNPIKYNNEPSLYTQDPDLIKEHFDEKKLPGYIEAKVPIFGICRGLQSINVFFGGTLYQDAPYHNFYSSKDRDELVHSVAPLKQDGSIAGASFKVNSLHHQSIKTLGNGLRTILRCDEKKTDTATIEGIAHNELPIAAVQFHPEHIYCGYVDLLINKLLNNE